MFFNKNLPIGHTISADDMIIRRPGLGMPPAKLIELVDSRLLREAEQYSPVTSDYFEDESF